MFVASIDHDESIFGPTLFLAASTAHPDGKIYRPRHGGSAMGERGGGETGMGGDNATMRPLRGAIITYPRDETSNALRARKISLPFPLPSLPPPRPSVRREPSYARLDLIIDR